MWWVVAGSPPEEWPSIWEPVSAEDDAQAAAEHAERACREAPAIPAAEQVQATISFRHKGRYIEQGTIPSRSDPLVRERLQDHSGWFQLPARPID